MDRAKISIEDIKNKIEFLSTYLSSFSDELKILMNNNILSPEETIRKTFLIDILISDLWNERYDEYIRLKKLLVRKEKIKMLFE